MKKIRQSNIELLRIISILLIISFHYVYKSNYVVQYLNYNSIVVKIFYFFGELGVNLFLLISSYFLIKGKFSFKKLLKLLFELLFYCVFTFFLAYLLKLPGYNTIHLHKVVDLLLSYWFFTTYILLYIISPFLNKMILCFDRKTFQKLILVCVFIWSIIPTFIGLLYNNTEAILFYNRFIWAIIIYFIGSYIRLYSIKFLEYKKIDVLLASSSFLLMVLSIFLIYNFKELFLQLGTRELSYLWTPNSIPMVILSISIFHIFLNINIGYKKIINIIGSCTLGIYLLHDGILNNYIWVNIFKTKECLNSNYPLTCILITTIIIFCVGIIIDLIRQGFEKITLNKFLDSKIYVKLSKKLFSFLDNILSIL